MAGKRGLLVAAGGEFPELDLFPIQTMRGRGARYFLEEAFFFAGRAVPSLISFSMA